MSNTIIPAGYRSVLNVHDTQIAIGHIKNGFNARLCAALNLSRVSAPLFVDASTGFNDDLNGVERAVAFDIKETGTVVCVDPVMGDYGKTYGSYTEQMCQAMRRLVRHAHIITPNLTEACKVISREQRNVSFLKETVEAIVGAVCDTLHDLKACYPQLDVDLNRDVTFVTTYELEEKYPALTPKQRENAAAKEYGTVFLMQIGDRLKSGEKHDGRAPDYDDWTLNGDILFYNPVLDCAFEISSMGIRVDKAALLSQLDKAGCPERKDLMFHRLLLDGTLPLTIGGGIGQSRVCMLLLGKAHVGEVQASVWDQETIRRCREAGVELL